MRIAYVCMDRGVPISGWMGSSVHVQEVIRALLARGGRVELFASRVSDSLPPGLETIPVHWIPALTKGPRAEREQAALAANRELRVALEGAGRFDLIYERYSLWSFAGMEFARDTGSPGLLEVNAPLIEQQAQYRGLVDRTSAEHVAERVFAAATALIALSQGIEAYLDRYPATHGRVHVISDGVNPDRFPVGLTPVCPGKPGTFTVGFVGSLKAWHGLPVLVEAFDMLHQRHPNSRMLIIGDGPERANLEKDVARRRLTEAFHLTGAVAPSEVPGLLASMDVAAAPYPEMPGFYFSPLKVYEYMAAGLPVVASRIGELADLIQDGISGLHCPPGDSFAVAAALGRLKEEPALRARLGQAARAHVVQHHTWDQVARRILDLARVERNTSCSHFAPRRNARLEKTS